MQDAVLPHRSAVGVYPVAPSTLVSPFVPPPVAEPPSAVETTPSTPSFPAPPIPKLDWKPLEEYEGLPERLLPLLGAPYHAGAFLHAAIRKEFERSPPFPNYLDGRVAHQQAQLLQSLLWKLVTTYAKHLVDIVTQAFATEPITTAAEVQDLALAPLIAIQEGTALLTLWERLGRHFAAMYWSYNDGLTYGALRYVTWQ